MPRFLFSALTVFTCLSVLAISYSATAKDIEGGKDHPLVSRFAGSEMQGYGAVDFDESIMPTRRIADDDAVTDADLIKVEGKITRLGYRIDPSKTPLEVMRNYEAALTAAGFQTIFSCVGDPCGSTEGLSLGAYIANGGKIIPSGFMSVSFNPANRYLLVRRSAPTGDVYVLVYVMKDGSNQQTLAYVQVTEVKPMQTGQVQVLSAEQMTQSLTSTGKVAIYGVYFDTAKADVKPDSAPALAEMTKLLKQNATMKVYIVGHTDNVGTLAGNLTLSQQRAEAVVKSLIASGIPADRLTAKGVASLSPVAPNTDETGRTLNRRVELVTQ